MVAFPDTARFVSAFGADSETYIQRIGMNMFMPSPIIMFGDRSEDWDHDDDEALSRGGTPAITKVMNWHMDSYSSAVMLLMNFTVAISLSHAFVMKILNVSKSSF
ncbi:hypothetical protein PG997_013678 [Apiospora hydei]|uniref:Copper transporter n=1 Tax=Apiospora hydei TaxID=1337664 RepID=A0ABR1V6V1_9PEZI